MKLKYKKILLGGLVAAISLASATAIITSCKDTKKIIQIIQLLNLIYNHAVKIMLKV